jgi:hypothetical protein
MESGEFSMAKYEWAKELGIHKSEPINFYGDLYERWINPFQDLFSYQSTCSSKECDLGTVSHSGKFSFTGLTNSSANSLEKVIQKYLVGHEGACRNEPRVTGKIVDLTGACDGVRSYSEKKLIEIVPFLSINVHGVVNSIEGLPRQLILCGNQYGLVGAVQHKSDHFVSVLVKEDGGLLYYDGLKFSRVTNQPPSGAELACAVYLSQ